MKVSDKSIQRRDASSDAGGRTKKWVVRLASILFWLIVWQILAWIIDTRIILVGPIDVIARLAELVVTSEFWASVGFSLSRIVAGYGLAVVAGIALAALASKFGVVRELLAPLMEAMKATPVASFTILVLLWVRSKNLSIVISFIMALPIVYTNVLEGIQATDPQLLEMCEVFGVRGLDRIRYVYVPELLPYLRSALTLALGLSWKSGIAAEVIGLPDNSIGEHLYDAKIYLQTPDLFAWTLTIILMSVAMEAIVSRLLDAIVRRWEARP